MNRLTVIVLGMALAIIGCIKIWLHMNTGAVLTLEGCQGGTFIIPIGVSSAHCWGCYVTALGMIISAAATIWPIAKLDNIPHLLNMRA